MLVRCVMIVTPGQRRECLPRSFASALLPHAPRTRPPSSAALRPLSFPLRRLCPFSVSPSPVSISFLSSVFPNIIQFIYFILLALDLGRQVLLKHPFSCLNITVAKIFQPVKFFVAKLPNFSKLIAFYFTAYNPQSKHVLIDS